MITITLIQGEDVCDPYPPFFIGAGSLVHTECIILVLKELVYDTLCSYNTVAGIWHCYNHEFPILVLEVARIWKGVVLH